VTCFREDLHLQGDAHAGRTNEQGDPVAEAAFYVSENDATLGTIVGPFWWGWARRTCTALKAAAEELCVW